MDEPVIVVAHSKRFLNATDTGSLRLLNCGLNLAWVHFYIIMTNSVP